MMARGENTVHLQIPKAILALCVSAILAGTCAAQFGKFKKPAAPPSEKLQQILGWLPADTETIVVANGPFSMPDLGTRDEETPGVESEIDLEENFEALPLALFGFKNEVLSKRLQGQKINLAIEGARHFGNPEGLGTAPFEGCSIALFARDVSDRTSTFLADSAKVALPSEQIEDQKVAVFQERLESDLWTFYVVFPKPGIAVACTNRDFLREVLVRMHNSRGTLALPDDLPEWKYIDTHTRFWGFRHFDKTKNKGDAAAPFAAENPAETSSDATGGMPAYGPDEQAIGLTFRFDPAKSRTAVVTYFSGDPGVLKNLKAGELSGGSEPAAKELNVEFSELSPGIFAIAYSLAGSPDSVNLFLMLLETSLGHSIFI